MLKLFSLFKIKSQFDGDELSTFLIQCTCCNKFDNCHISDVKQDFFTKKGILPVFIKDFVFRHIGISWMIVKK